MYVQVDGTGEDSLNIENTAWSNTVVASSTAVGAVIYTGCETRSVMNTSKASMKVGLYVTVSNFFGHYINLLLTYVLP